MALDEYDLARFLQAQQFCINAVRRELRGGRKLTHWIWFIFPQLRGLGVSPRSQRFGISGRDEAHAYLAHPVLGARLVECTELVAAAAPRPASEIFGHPDDLKFHSSMTLFATVKPDAEVFVQALDLLFAGEFDEATVTLLGDT